MSTSSTHGFAPVVTPDARARAHDGGSRVLPDRPRAGVRRRRRRAVPRRHERGRRCRRLHRGRDVRARRAARALRRVSRSCFRREAGTYGKDTRGIFRVHQFDKVEMFSFVAPDESWEEHERILAIEEQIIGGLGLPYHVVNIAAGDLGPAAAKKYDIEAWLPSEGRYRELTSCSNYTDYSARRLGTRVKGEQRQRVRAHAERHRLRDQPHARVPVRALPGRRRRLRRPRRAPPLHRLRPASNPASSQREDRAQPTRSLATHRVACRRRDARAAEWDGLENRWATSPVGSNPTPSASSLGARLLPTG